jgi:hypothetical protein
MAQVGPQAPVAFTGIPQQQPTPAAAQAAPVVPAAQGNGERLSGNPPSICTGDCTLVKWFVWELNIYFGLNEGCDMEDNPMKKTLLALGFLKGDVIDDWVDVQHNWINKQCAPMDPNTNHVQVPSTNLIYWTHFMTEFN